MSYPQEYGLQLESYPPTFLDPPSLDLTGAMTAERPVEQATAGSVQGIGRGASAAFLGIP